MKKLITLIILTQIILTAHAQKDVEVESKGPPGTEIVLANLDFSNNQVIVSDGINITSQIGYDSQPAFMENDKAIYFTKYIEKQTDIYRYDIVTQKTSAFTQTPESEYSATAIPKAKGISVVRVDMDKSQNVYRLHKKKAIKRNNIDNVGYHNWTGKKKLWMFVINGEIGNLFYQATGQKPKQMASNIGRAIKSDTKYKNLYYVDKSQDDWWIKKIDTKKFKQAKVIALPKGVEDFAIDAKGNYWCGKGNTLYYSQKGKNWVIVKEFSIQGLSNITRIDINSKMTQIAITFDEIISK